MAKSKRSRSARTIYRFIQSHAQEFCIRAMCRTLGVHPSGYCAWLMDPSCDHAREDQRLLGPIKASFVASHGDLSTKFVAIQPVS
jgi:putative transposase